MENKKLSKDIPIGLKIISILYYLFAGILVLVIFGLFIALRFYRVDGEGLTDFVRILLIFVSVPFTILFFFVARNLSKGREWARIVAIILSILFIINVFLSIIRNPLSILPVLTQILCILINGFIAIYLLFSRKAKEFFSKKKM